jgi:phosphoribosylformylglycinamidine synthase
VPSAITDCLNYGNPEIEEVFWDFYEGIRGVGEACSGIGLMSHEGSHPLPVVSGNVSFYNQGKSGKAIPPSPIICTVGVVEDYSKSRSMTFKEEGNEVFLIGEPLDELGGSEYYRTIYGTLGGNVPEADFPRERGQIRTVLDLHSHGWIRSCHDTGQGGLLTALAEMAIGGNGAGRLGLAVDIDEFGATGLPPEKVLFSETGCFVVELPPGNERELLAICARNRVKLHRLGTLKASPKLEVVTKGKAIASWELGELADIYMTGCRSIFGIEKGE